MKRSWLPGGHVLQTSPRSTSDSTRAGRGALALRPPRYGVAAADRLSPELQGSMEAAFGADFSRVRTREDAAVRDVGARAYTRGAELRFAPGQYQPNTAAGRALVAHELAHTVQQWQGRVAPTARVGDLVINDDGALEAEAHRMGARAAAGERVSDLRGADVSAGSARVAQCYVEQTIASKSWRVADDMTMAIRQDTQKPAYGSHVFFAESALITSSSATLKAQTSRLELSAGSETMKVTDGKVSKTLNRVEPKNLKDKTSGTGMQWPDDCGYAANSIMQGDKRTTKAVYSDPDTEKKASDAATKAVIGTLGTSPVAVALAYAASVAASTHETSPLNYATDEVQYKGATLYTPHMMLDEVLKATLDPDPVKAWAKYQKMTPKQRDEFDRNVGINKYADPQIGEAYSIVSNKDEHVAGKTAWNFHWGGVCMKSGGDHVTMENFAGSGGSAWDFQMYGSANKVGQTFHEQQQPRTHGASGQAEYGPNPTTIRVRRH